jgi:hypothetical protein
MSGQLLPPSFIPDAAAVDQHRASKPQQQQGPKALKTRAAAAAAAPVEPPDVIVISDSDDEQEDEHQSGANGRPAGKAAAAADAAAAAYCSVRDSAAAPAAFSLPIAEAPSSKQQQHCSSQHGMTAEGLLQMLQASKSKAYFKNARTAINIIISASDDAAPDSAAALATADAALLLRRAPQLLLPCLLEAVEEQQYLPRTALNILSAASNMLDMLGSSSDASVDNDELQQLQQQLDVGRQQLLVLERAAKQKIRQQQQLQLQHESEVGRQQLLAPRMTRQQLREQHGQQQQQQHSCWQQQQQQQQNNEGGTEQQHGRQHNQAAATTPAAAAQTQANVPSAANKTDTEVQQPGVVDLQAAAADDAAAGAVAAEAADSKQHSPGQQQQQQQQQQAGSDGSKMTVEQLKQLLQQQLSAASFSSHLTAFTIWSKACGSNDVAHIMRNFDALLHRLKGTAATPASAAKYLRRIQKVVELPEVTALHSAAEAVALCGRIAAARKEFAKAGNSAEAAGAQQQMSMPSVANKTDTEVHEAAGLVESQAAASAAAEAEAAGDAAADSAAAEVEDSKQKSLSQHQQQPRLQQQQQQQRDNGDGGHMTVEQLKQLLQQQQLSAASITNHLAAFATWSRVCGSNDVAHILHNFDALLQKMKGKDAAGSAALAPASAAAYLKMIRKIVQLPEVKALQSAAEAEALHSRIAAARKRYAKVVNTAKTAAAAAEEEEEEEQLAASEPGRAQKGRETRNSTAANAEATAAAATGSQEAPAAGDAAADSTEAADNTQQPAGQHKQPLSQQQQSLRQHQPPPLLQQQQQQGSGVGGNKMTVDQVKQLLQQQQMSAAYTTNHFTAFLVWSRACGSNDVAHILRNFDVLLQRLNGTDAAGNPPFTPGSAAEYLRLIQKITRLPEVKALQSAAEAEALDGRISAARREFARMAYAAKAAAASQQAPAMKNAAADDGTSAADAAAAAASGGGTPVAVGHKRSLEEAVRISNVELHRVSHCRLPTSQFDYSFIRCACQVHSS